MANIMAAVIFKSCTVLHYKSFSSEFIINLYIRDWLYHMQAEDNQRSRSGSKRKKKEKKNKDK